MAFNWQTFRTRTLTAIIFVAIMLSGLLWNHWSFFILFSIIHFGCWWEYLNIVERINNIKINIAIRILLMISGYVLFLNIGIRWIHFDFLIGKGGLMISLKWVFFFSLAGFLLIYLFQNQIISFRAKWMTLAGVAYISLTWGLMLNLYRVFNVHVSDTMYIVAANRLPLLIIISIWINDTMAYIVGSIIGKTPLSKISPKKTWEGTIGGIILSIVVVGLVAFYGFKLEWLTIYIMIIAAIASISGTFGDIFESKLKRMANVKDSGSLMPGHGGFLDRFDSLLLATPFVWLYVYFFSR